MFGNKLLFRVLGLLVAVGVTIALTVALTQVFGSFFLALGIVCATCTVVALAFAVPEANRIFSTKP